MPMPELTLFTYAILFITGLVAGFVDSIAGGGGIISLPVLLSVGFPPALALGTNKLQSSFGSLTASLNYTRKGIVQFRETLPTLLFTAIGAASGAFFVQRVSQNILNVVIPILLFGVFLFSLLSRNLGIEDGVKRLRPWLFSLIFGSLFGLYDGAFGPGVGSFWVIAFVFFLGYNLKKATGYTKWANFTSNFIALLAFAIGGNVMLLPGIVMAVGQVSGAIIGSNLVVSHSTRFIKAFFLTVVGITILRLLYVTFAGG